MCMAMFAIIICVEQPGTVICQDIIYVLVLLVAFDLFKLFL
jgi:hypothetical protein